MSPHQMSPLQVPASPVFSPGGTAIGPLPGAAAAGVAGAATAAFSPGLFPASLAVTPGVVVRPMASPTGDSS